MCPCIFNQLFVLFSFRWCCRVTQLIIHVQFELEVNMWYIHIIELEPSIQKALCTYVLTLFSPSKVIGCCFKIKEKLLYHTPHGVSMCQFLLQQGSHSQRSMSDIFSVNQQFLTVAELLHQACNNLNLWENDYIHVVHPVLTEGYNSKSKSTPSRKPMVVWADTKCKIIFWTDAVTPDCQPADDTEKDSWLLFFSDFSVLLKEFKV